VDFSKADREQSSANLVLMILMILNLNIVREKFKIFIFETFLSNYDMRFFDYF
jgi:hypothetical protein